MIRILIFISIFVVNLLSFNINSKEFKEYQSLVSFIEQNNLNAFKEKLQQKNPNIYNIYSPTLLETSSKLDRLKFIKYLDHKGLNLDLKTKAKKQSMVHIAIDNKSYKSADYLIRRIKNINVQDKDGRTLLHIAVKNSANYIIKLLLSQGIDKTIKDKFGKTAYDMAKKNIAIDILVLPKLNTKVNGSSQVVKELKNNKIQKKLQSSSINNKLKVSKINDRLKSSKIMNTKTDKYIQKDVYIGE